MLRQLAFYLIFFIQIPFALSGPFSGNTIDDAFTVKSVDGRQAVVQGKVKSLKVGDELFFVRSPFKFTITEIKGDKVTIAVPEKSDLTPGSTLVRNQTEAMRKAMLTEQHLKNALEE